jgi:4-amino-4-deoxy-L-arabinose transferase-like glycosyltransferase/Tfp pilus assembly protein PilF
LSAPRLTINLRRCLSGVPSVVWVLALTLACLAPFLNKAFHIDDTLFLWVGRHIQEHPADPFGFTVNWFGFSYPMIKSFENPPLTCYFIALAASIVGWSEVALHAAFLPPALACAWGIHSLARQYCQRPLLAAVTAILTPVFLLSSTTLMCDVMLLAFWVWSIVFFEKGLTTNHPAAFVVSGIISGLAALTKFPGLALVPLFLACGWKRQRRLGWWLTAPIIPLLCAATYEWWTRRMYGQGLLLAAATYASGEHQGNEGLLPERLVVGLGFLGGSFLPTLFFAPMLWRRRTLLIGLVCLGPFLALLPTIGPLERLLWWQGEQFDWISFAQSALFTVAGLHIIVLAAIDFWNRRDGASLCLLLWTAGIFVFATVVNWTMNGRSLLPMAPAVGILVARRIDQRFASATPEPFWQLAWPSIPAAVLSLALVKADYDLAGVNRAAANELCARYARPGQPLWFRGHWGFQYYMERLGAKPLDTLRTALSPGDRVVLPDPRTASNVFDVPADVVRLLEVLEFRPNKYYATMSVSAAAGFYSSRNGLLPFAAGKIDPIRFYVFEATQSLDGTTHFADHHSSVGAWEQQQALETETSRFQAALNRNPNDPEAHFQLGLAWLGRAQPREAAVEFSAVLRVKPDDLAARLQLAGLASSQHNTSEAIDRYRDTLRVAPDSVLALNNLAWILATDSDQRFRNGREAVSLAERASALTARTNALVTGTLAAAYAEAGRFDDAIAAANQAIQTAENSSADQSLVVTNRQLLELYQTKRAYHQH